ncbi:MAG: hypothetical protein EA398_03840 [Deltaproteobacteria bacterium]|nr:MAG: hypothetical protein EA398_03840 [Deltaproteobacteria bacterium]
MPLPTAPGPRLEPVWQIDGRNGTILLEPGTARLRGITLRRSDGLWQLDVLDFAEVASGWLPGTLRVTHDDRTVLTLRITDAAPTASNLAPLPAIDGPPPRTPFPRLPL